jgi:O-antigen ligase
MTSSVNPDPISLTASPHLSPRRARAATQKRTDLRAAKDKLPLPVSLFVVSLIIPWMIPMGPVIMPVYRLVLAILLLPCVFMWLNGKAGRIRLPDIGLILFCVWAASSLVIAHGVAGAIQPAGVLLVETLGAYLLARCYIRDAASFRSLILFMAKLIVLLAPFAVYEWLTGSKPILAVFSMVFPTVDVTLMVPRLGFWRVQGPFSHSILFGLFCGSTLAMTHLVLGYGKSFSSRWLLTTSIAIIAFLSMSSAPIAGIMVQIALTGWALVLNAYPRKWAVLASIALAAFLVVDFGSNQTPIQFYISHFTFDQQTGWYRIWIWNYGSASVLNHPWFGIGFADWARPSWMGSDSIDNFWLVTAMRHGIPAFVLTLASCLWITVTIGLKKGLSQELSIYRTAYLISMVAYFIVGTTVHLWGPPYAWFAFLLGSGTWLLDVKSNEQKPAAQPNPADRTTRRHPQQPSGSNGNNPGRTNRKTAI